MPNMSVSQKQVSLQSQSHNFDSAQQDSKRSSGVSNRQSNTRDKKEEEKSGKRSVREVTNNESKGGERSSARG